MPTHPHLRLVPSPPPRRVPLGKLSVTPGVLALICCATGDPTVNAHAARATRDLSDALGRHAVGDWGPLLGAADRAANDASLVDGSRLLSAYLLDGTKVWILTEADRSRTTILLPEEY